MHTVYTYIHVYLHTYINSCILAHIYIGTIRYMHIRTQGLLTHTHTHTQSEIHWKRGKHADTEAETRDAEASGWPKFSHRFLTATSWLPLMNFALSSVCTVRLRGIYVDRRTGDRTRMYAYTRAVTSDVALERRLHRALELSSAAIRSVCGSA